MSPSIVSVLVCTRNRPRDLARLLESLLSCPPTEADLQVIVVDQSDDDETRRVVEARRDHRVELFSARPGKGRALNLGIAHARGSIVVCTDDDCEAPPGWAEAMTRVLEDHPSAAVLFCRVVAGPVDDSSAGYVPAFPVAQSRLVRDFSEFRQLGMGAGMALRTRAVREMDGFDECFGPGSPFPSCDDWDICHRALLCGWSVYEAREPHTVHHGFRPYFRGREHVRRDWLAIGALCAKGVRSGRRGPVGFWTRFFYTEALYPLIENVLRVRPRKGFWRVAYFLEGFVKALTLPLNRRTLRFEVLSGASR